MKENERLKGLNSDGARTDDYGTLGIRVLGSGREEFLE